VHLQSRLNVERQYVSVLYINVMCHGVKQPIIMQYAFEYYYLTPKNLGMTSVSGDGNVLRLWLGLVLHRVKE
jgi:hypothetical protein